MSVLNDLLRVYWGSPSHQAFLLISYIILVIIALKPALPKHLLSKIIFVSDATENAEHFPSNVRNAKHSVVANEYTRNRLWRFRSITNEKMFTKAIIWFPVLVSIVFAAVKVIYYSITFGPTGAGTDVYVQMRSAHLFMNGISPYTETSHFVYPPLYFIMILIPILIYDSPVSIYIAYAIFFPLSIYFFVKLANKIFNNEEYVLASALALVFLPVFWKGVDCNFNGLVAVGMLLSILLSLDAIEKLKTENYKSARNTLVAASFIVGVITSIRIPVILPFFAAIIILREIPWKLKLNAFMTCGLTIGIIHIVYYLMFGWEMFYYTYFRVTEDVLGLNLIGVLQRSGIDAMILAKILPFFLILLPLLYCYQKKINWLPALIIVTCGFYLSSPYVTEKYFSWFAPLLALFIWKLDSKRKRLMMVMICCLLSATIAAYSLPVPIAQVVGDVTAVVNILSIITTVLLVIILAIVWIYSATEIKSAEILRNFP